jgi:hypothetical protein
LAEEYQGNRAVSRHGSRWEDNVINELDEVGYECVDWHQQFEGRVTWNIDLNLRVTVQERQIIKKNISIYDT